MTYKLLIHSEFFFYLFKGGLYYEGCYGESSDLSKRDLPHNAFTDGAMTIEMCVDHCLNNSYKYAGIMVSPSLTYS